MPGVFVMKKNKKKTAKNCKKDNKKTKEVKITEERQSFVFKERARGKSYQGVANSFADEFGVKIGLTGIRDFLKRHEEQYRAFMKDLKDVRLANEKARIYELEGKAVLLGSKIDYILTSVAPSMWDSINLSSLIKEFRELLNQIAIESGDRTDKGGNEKSQVIQIYNNIPGVLADNGSSDKKQNSRIDLSKI